MLNTCFLALIILIASIFQISHWAGAHNVHGRWSNIFAGVSIAVKYISFYGKTLKRPYAIYKIVIYSFMRGSSRPSRKDNNVFQGLSYSLTHCRHCSIDVDVFFSNFYYWPTYSHFFITYLIVRIAFSRKFFTSVLRLYNKLTKKKLTKWKRSKLKIIKHIWWI